MDLDITKVNLLQNNIIVQELSEHKVGSIYLPGDVTHGMQAKVLNVADGPLCEHIYPGDIALLKSGAFHEYLGGNLFIFRAVHVWGVLRGGKPFPVNEYVLVRVDAEEDDTDAETGIWTPTEARDFPETGWCEWEGKDWHVHYNVMGSQRRIKIAGQVYSFMGRDNLTGIVED